MILNKTKYIIKEFGINFLSMFALSFILSFIFLVFLSPNNETFWYMLLYVTSGILGVSLINAFALLFVDIFVRNKNLNSYLSFISILLFLLIICFSKKVSEIQSGNLIKMTLILTLISFVSNFLRFKRVKKNNTPAANSGLVL